jgi:hypothetical protein
MKKKTGMRTVANRWYLVFSLQEKPIAYSLQPKAAAVEQPLWSSRCGAAEGKAAG